MFGFAVAGSITLLQWEGPHPAKLRVDAAAGRPLGARPKLRRPGEAHLPLGMC